MVARASGRSRIGRWSPLTEHAGPVIFRAGLEPYNGSALKQQLPGALVFHDAAGCGQYQSAVIVEQVGQHLALQLAIVVNSVQFEDLCLGQTGRLCNAIVHFEVGDSELLRQLWTDGALAGAAHTGQRDHRARTRRGGKQLVDRSSERPGQSIQPQDGNVSVPGLYAGQKTGGKPRP